MVSILDCLSFNSGRRLSTSIFFKTFCLQLGAAWNKSSQLAWYFLRRTTSGTEINRGPVAHGPQILVWATKLLPIIQLNIQTCFIKNLVWATSLNFPISIPELSTNSHRAPQASIFNEIPIGANGKINRLVTPFRISDPHKNKQLVEDHPVIISIMLQFHRLSSF